MHFFSISQIQRLEKYLGVKQNPGKNEEILWKKMEKYTPLFSKIPGILCICVGNSLAMNAVHKNSDIDLFIITKKNRIWTARFFLTLLLTLLGERKTAKKHAGKFCLSFFITEDALNLKDIAIKNDIYLAYWIQTLRPVLNREEIFERLQKINLTPLSILSGKERGNHNKQIGAVPSPSRRGLGRGILGNLFEKSLKTIFLPRTQKSFQKLGKPFGVIISDDMLKFHDKDRRKKIRDTILS